jgi:hydroxymethylpyrimidine pyrophosphatase-like HAD family hydrolase
MRFGTESFGALIGDAACKIYRFPRWAGAALTVENSTPAVKQLAHYVGPSCEVGGMADAVVWLLRGKTAAEAV